MKLSFQGEDIKNLGGFSGVFEALEITPCADGVPVFLTRGAPGELDIQKSRTQSRFGMARSRSWRALGYLREHAQAASFAVSETARFDTNGVMLDVCQNNAALLPSAIRMYLDRMAIMGLNTLYLYMEDSFEIPEEPYFGHMRGRYTRAELMALDAYAAGLGITLIPCVQTLAHLSDVLKWQVYAPIREDDDVLLVGEERTYTFLRHLLAEVRRTFRSKKIHIGMDEAFRLGRGAYMDRHGAHPQLEIMKEHLSRVLAICAELGIEPMVWSDMLINASHGQDTGMVDAHLKPGEMTAQYEKVAGMMRTAATRNGDFSFVFTFLTAVAEVLEKKAEVGLALKAAYDRDDRAALRTLADTTLPEIKRRMTSLWKTHRALWFRTNKAFGWETMELRYGAAILRLDTASMRVSAYLNGEVSELSELSEPRLSFSGKDEFPYENRFARMVSASHIS